MNDLSDTARMYIDASDSIILGPETLHLVRSEHLPPRREFRVFSDRDYMPLRSACLIGLSDHRVLRGHTVGIRDDAVCMVLSTPLQLGDECRLLFSLSIRDQLTAVSGIGIVIACERKQDNLYRIDLKFDIDNPRAKIIVTQLLRHGTSTH